MATNDAGLSLVLYMTANCHLCADAAILLDEIIGPEAYQAIDIETDPDLVARYGWRVPVVAVGGEDRLEAPISGPDLVKLLEELGYSTTTLPFMPG